MSTAASSPATPGTHDVAGTPSSASRRAIPFGRLLRVELRKLVDAPGAWIFHLVIALLTVGFVLLALLLLDELTFNQTQQLARLPLTYLLPVVGVLVATEEWTHRSAMVTFTLEPRRHRVIAAKLIAVVAAVVAHLALAWLASAVATAIHGVPQGAWETSAGVLGGGALVLVAQALGGFALGLVLMNRVFAIVLIFLLPILLQILTAWGTTAPIVPWIDAQESYAPLVAGLADVTPTEWQHAAVTFGIWVVLLTVVGFWLNGRREVK